MRARFLLQVGLIVFMAAGLTMCKQPAETPEGTETPSASGGPSTQETTAPAAVAEQVQAYKLLLRSARRSVRNRNAQQGALELSDAAQRLSEQADASSEEVKELLQYSVSELSGLAERVFNPSSIGEYDVDKAVTHALWAQARYHFEKASERWANGQAVETAAYLNAAAAYIDEAVGYFTGDVEAESEALVRQLRSLSRQLEAGADLDNAAVSARMADFGKKVEQYNEQVRVAIETHL